MNLKVVSKGKVFGVRIVVCEFPAASLHVKVCASMPYHASGLEAVETPAPWAHLSA